MRRLVAAAVALAVLAAPLAAAAARGPAHPSRSYCKKHARHLTSKQRRWCARGRHSSRGPAPPATPPLTQAPGVDPTLGTAAPPPATTTTTSPATTSPTTTTTTAARLAVSAKEYSLTLSRTQIASGAAIVELQNNGEDPHDLRIEPLDGGSPAVDFTPTGPGELNRQRLTLAAGSYRLYCTLGSHDALGMHATLTVAP